MTNVIFHADDYGLNYGFSDGILDCFERGVIRSTSVRVNGTAYKQTLNRLKTSKGLDVGLHVNLTDGLTSTSAIADKKWNYYADFLRYLYLVNTTPNIIKSIKGDVYSQFEKANKDKLNLTHVDGHEHIHMIPQIFEVVSQACKEYKIKYIRVANEPPYFASNIGENITPIFNANFLRWSVLKAFSKKNYKIAKKYKLKSLPFYGVIHTDKMSRSNIIDALRDAKRRNFKTVEILSHPTKPTAKDRVFTSDFIEEYTNRKNRQIEREAMKSGYLIDYLTKNRYTLLNFGSL